MGAPLVLIMMTAMRVRCLDPRQSPGEGFALRNRLFAFAKNRTARRPVGVFKAAAPVNSILGRHEWAGNRTPLSGPRGGGASIRKSARRAFDFRQEIISCQWL